MKLNLLVIRTTHPEKLAQFYELLGISFAYHRHGEGQWHYSATIDETVFEIYPLMQHQHKPDRSLRLGFSVPDLDQLMADLNDKNVKIVAAPKQAEWGYSAIIMDVDGRKIELKQA